MVSTFMPPDTPLIPEQRREMILRQLHRDQVLSVHQLTDLLGVSHMTIRRDIAALEHDGKAISIAGGVRLASHVRTEPSRIDKSTLETGRKASIAALASTLIRDEMVVYLDAGTTTLAIVPHLLGRSGLTVITNDFAIVDELGAIGNIDAVHIGGQIEWANRSTVGPLAATTLAKLNTDLAIISASSWSVKHGVTSPSPSKVQVKTAALATTSEAVLVADSSKYGSFSLHSAIALREFTSIVTDGDLSEGAAGGIRDLGVQLMLASPVEENDRVREPRG
ncbi:DeoR/GlpR family DNA-binding transcription regulator [Mycetocola sp. 2940]|uniref:DeoR/GlpR family DNA-binding transcription regulator n=1 Tax=Mycetocola sp. 2940 TaxID=3156452 RepID=UPI00339245B2